MAHIVAANLAGAIGKAVGMLVVCRTEQQQSRRKRAAGDDDDIRAIEFCYAISYTSTELIALPDVSVCRRVT